MIRSTRWPHIKLHIIVFQFLSTPLSRWTAPCCRCTWFPRDTSWVNSVASTRRIHWINLFWVTGSAVMWCTHCFTLLHANTSNEKYDWRPWKFCDLLFINPVIVSRSGGSVLAEQYEFPYFHGFRRHFEIQHVSQSIMETWLLRTMGNSIWRMARSYGLAKVAKILTSLIWLETMSNGKQYLWRTLNILKVNTAIF